MVFCTILYLEGHRESCLKPTVTIVQPHHLTFCTFIVNSEQVITHRRLRQCSGIFCVKFGNWTWKNYTQIIPQFECLSLASQPASIYLLKVNNRNTRTKSEICSKLTIETSEQPQWCHSGVFSVNFEHISHFVLVFLLLTLNM